jgi:hypothetical protein
MDLALPALKSIRAAFYAKTAEFVKHAKINSIWMLIATPAKPVRLIACFVMMETAAKSVKVDTTSMTLRSYVWTAARLYLFVQPAIIPNNVLNADLKLCLSQLLKPAILAATLSTAALNAHPTTVAPNAPAVKKLLTAAVKTNLPQP